MSNEKIIAYKAFDKDLKCRGYQYEIGVEYEQDGPIVACSSGFHACERPLDVLSYYPPSGRFCVVEQSGTLSRDTGDTKVASSKIKIGEELDVPGLVKAQVEYVKAHTTTDHTDPNAATAGYYGAAMAGNRGAATAGDYGAATAGDYGAATAGRCGAATAGNYGFALSGGESVCGKNGVAAARGPHPMARGGDGATLVLTLTDVYRRHIRTETLVIQGLYKPDTWYTLGPDGIKEVTAP